MTSRNRTPVPSTPPPDPAEVAKHVAAIRQRLASAANERIVPELQKLYVEPFPCYGIRLPDAHHIGMDFMRQLRTVGLPMAMEVADPLFRSGKLEEGIVGDAIVNSYGRHIGGIEFEKFDAWIGALTNPINGDDLSTHLISRALAGKPSLVNRLLEWTKSPSRLRRRAAVVSFVPLVRDGRFMADALSVAERLMEEQDEVVQRGIGWMLMEASRLQTERVVEFLRPWKGKASRVILEGAAEKMMPANRALVLG